MAGYNVEGMAFVTILPFRVRVEMRLGQRLLDVLDETERPIFRTACRAGNCGACRLSVAQGAAEWRAPSSREHATLMQLRAAADERLGCQLVLAGDPPDDLVLVLP
ncbi:MAG TPA: 2Fe-2S iron-sulfur cluster-binding protein [Polyangiales bacterium]|nr:2Fe-2S iron-sulfur cluster-binding protein [Polyangiales bacterium]